MKKTVLTTLSLMAALSSMFGQVVLEETYPENIGIDFDNSGNAIYYSRSINSNGEIQFYDKNHNLTQTTDVSALFGTSLAERPYDESDEGKTERLIVEFCTDKLFDLDAEFEFLLTVSVIDSITNNDYNTTSDVYIIDNDGEVILKREEAVLFDTDNPHGYGKEIYFDGDSYKMDLQLLNENRSTKGNAIYSLPGSINSITAIDDESSKNKVRTNSYPNPAIEYTKIAYQLPEGTNNAELIIYNQQGQEIEKHQVGNAFNDILINTTSFQSGTYIYNIISGGQSTVNGNFVVMK